MSDETRSERRKRISDKARKETELLYERVKATEKLRSFLNACCPELFRFPPGIPKARGETAYLKHNGIVFEIRVARDTKTSRPLLDSTAPFRHK